MFRPTTCLLLLLAACKTTDPLYCDEDTPCTDPDRPFCDLTGEYPASEGHGRTCIADPFPDGGPDPTGDGGVDGDGGTSRFGRIFFAKGPGQGLHVVDVEDGVPGESTELTAGFANQDPSLVGLDVAHDGKSAVFGADGRMASLVDVYWTRLVGETWETVRVSGDHGDDWATIASFKADGSGVIYYAAELGGFGGEYNYVDLSGESAGEPISLGSGLDGGVSSSDGARFAFIDGGNAFLVDLEGPTPSDPVQISPDVAGGAVAGELAMSPDGTRVAFVGDFETDGINELWVVDTSDGTPGEAERVNGPLVDGGQVQNGLSWRLVEFSPDSNKLLYVADEKADERFELFVVDVSGAVPGPSYKVNGTLASGGDVSKSFDAMAFSPDSRFIAYIADQRTNDVTELFLVDVSGATPAGSQRISGTVDGMSSFAFAPSADGLAYAAFANGPKHLYFVDLSSDSPGAAQRISPTLTSDEDVRDTVGRTYQFSPDGAHLAFVVGDATEDRFELYVSDVSGATATDAEHVQQAEDLPYLIMGTAFLDNRSLVYATTGGPSSVRIADVRDGAVGEVTDVAGSAEQYNLSFFVWNQL
jgi:Tol biopolymer transport system component